MEATIDQVEVIRNFSSNNSKRINRMLRTPLTIIADKE